MNKKWWKAAFIRCLKTMAQTVVSMVTVGTTITAVDWLSVVSVSIMAGIASLATSLAGLPELGSESKVWWKAAAIRAIKTVAQVVAGSIAVGATLTSVNWLEIVYISLVAGILSVLTSVTGLPESTDTKLLG